MNYQDILDFWFSPETQPNWFAKSDQFDQSLKEKFGDILEQAVELNCGHGVRMLTAVWQKSLFWTSFHAIFFGIRRVLLLRTVWLWHWLRKPSARIWTSS
jgi:Uncharacterized protein conserved in bacteria